MSTEQLIGQLRQTHELRDLFLRWFGASSTDLDAQLAPAADDIVAYDHYAPQEHRGIDALRAVRAQALTSHGREFRWDIPDLHLRIVGDIAIGWGLHRSRDTGPDGIRFEEWSRGTHVFERRDGRWQMIHQHLSYPIDTDGHAHTAR